ncbi:MAG: ribosome silencing factor [Candidatus Xenobiia bacterium LiM19]
MTSKELTALIIEIAEEKKAENMLILDFDGVSILYDYVLLLSASSRVQTRAIARAVDEKVKKLKPFRRHIHGMAFGTWILLDYGNIVLHIFTEKERHFYDLEELWKDVPLVSPSDFKSIDISSFLAEDGEESVPLE